MRKLFTSREVYNSEEFKALCEKFGIIHNASTKRINIYLDMEGAVTIELEYYAAKPRKDGEL